MFVCMCVCVCMCVRAHMHAYLPMCVHVHECTIYTLHILPTKLFLVDNLDSFHSVKQASTMHTLPNPSLSLYMHNEPDYTSP